MKTSDFDFELPEELIAQLPLPERDASRLLVLPRRGGAPIHSTFHELSDWLQPGDLLVLNDAKVIPARLRGVKAESGGKVELLLCDPLPPQEGKAVWRCMAGSSKPLRLGARIHLAPPPDAATQQANAPASSLAPMQEPSSAQTSAGEPGAPQPVALGAQVVALGADGFVDVAFDEAPDALLDRVEELGELPLPPYMRRSASEIDKERYQTIFARSRGAVAAPTAGLHFTDAVFESLREKGVETANVTLHVGPGTFLPVRAEAVEDHRMHAERYEISQPTADAIASAKAEGRRVIAVGTTALRTLESAARADGTVTAGPGVSEIFIWPGYELKVADGLLTNFHLPRSTLVMLVAALTGRERLLAAYAEAVEHRYRFYSYGDAMLVS